jgi:tRNA-2-methylthio-N6-dimethylallyladenosine synthase
LKEPLGFTGLLKNITHQIDGKYWIRFMTSHPKDITKELLDEMAVNPKICPNLHLPFQAGANRILQNMNRKYTKEQYLEIVEYAKRKMPDLVLTSDVIVGYPGETYEDFAETLDLIKKVRFAALFTFIYSPRPGTPAANLHDPTPYGQKAQWMGELLKLQREIGLEINAGFVGQTQEVLVEQTAPNGQLQGRTAGGLLVEIEGGGPNLVGEFCKVQICGYGSAKLKGIRF